MYFGILGEGKTCLHVDVETFKTFPTALGYGAHSSTTRDLFHSATPHRKFHPKIASWPFSDQLEICFRDGEKKQKTRGEKYD